MVIKRASKRLEDQRKQSGARLPNSTRDSRGECPEVVKTMTRSMKKKMRGTWALLTSTNLLLRTRPKRSERKLSMWPSKFKKSNREICISRENRRRRSTLPCIANARTPSNRSLAVHASASLVWTTARRLTCSRVRRSTRRSFNNLKETFESISGSSTSLSYTSRASRTALRSSSESLTASMEATAARRAPNQSVSRSAPR